MTAQAVHMEFAPPATPGLLRSLVLAILAHGLLLIMLTLGVQWRHEAPNVTVEAELWSALPQEAAPPPPEPAPEPALQPPPPAAEPAPAQPDPSIAIAREKALKQKALEKEKLAQLEKLQAEKRKKEKEAHDKAARDKAAADKKLQEQKTQDAKVAADAKRLEELRQQNIKRMAGLAAGTGDANSSGTAAQSSGPSPSYGGRIRARIKPNITFTDSTNSNPTAEVEVRTSPDGTIISRKLTKSSGLKSWDDAVLNAIDKTEVLPKDVDGRAPPTLIISFRPRD
ncbi:MAG: cell envelope integrity protein TolA [Burkholderiales bacterium]|nr:cell envelope integrity protein TolA [Burkholderiales bacterium]